jgi:hypothetical protein
MNPGSRAFLLRDPQQNAVTRTLVAASIGMIFFYREAVINTTDHAKDSVRHGSSWQAGEAMACFGSQLQ